MVSVKKKRKLADGLKGQKYAQGKSHLPNKLVSVRHILEIDHRLRLVHILIGWRAHTQHIRERLF